MKLKFYLIFVVSIIASLQMVEAADALIAYTSYNGANEFREIVKVKYWNSTVSTWSPFINLSNSGSFVLQVAAEYWNWSSEYFPNSFPNRFKALIASQSRDGYLDLYYCTAPTSPECGINKSRWGFQSNVGKVPVYVAPYTYERYFDLERESSTNDSLLVYAVNNSDSGCDLAYQVIPGTSFDFTDVSEQCLDDSGHGTDVQYTWVSLVAKPNLNSPPWSRSQEMILVALDGTNSDINAWVWDGSSWGNQVEISASASHLTNYEGLSTTYAADGSKGMVIGTDGTTGKVNYRYWDGSSWSGVSSFDIDTSGSEDALWLTLKADPSTDDLQAVIVDNAADLTTAYWDGSSWQVTQNIDTAVDQYYLRGADFAWDPSGSTGKLVWDTDASGTTLSQRTCSPQCTGSTSTISTYGQTGSWVTLYGNPTATDSVNILGVRLNANGDVGSFKWSGSVFTNYGDEAITANTGNLVGESYSLHFLG